MQSINSGAYEQRVSGAQNRRPLLIRQLLGIKTIQPDKVIQWRLGWLVHVERTSDDQITHNVKEKQRLHMIDGINAA